MRLVTQLLAATADAHSPRALVRAIAMALVEHVPITRVELAAPRAIAVRDGDGWRCVDAAPTVPLVQLAPGLAVAGKVPSGFASPELRAAIAQVIAAASRHLEVVQRVATLSRRAHAEARELRRDRDRTPDLIARSPAMREAIERLELVARHPTTVLLVGESGVGKEVLARELHRRSPRGHRPMVQLNCGALPEGLVESELFGHERGAFTGAERTHVGAFERADRGTLLLDEIGELSPAAQAKLLRVLQDGTIRRVGGTAPIAVDVRLVAATNRDLRALVRAGAFREDLLYRLDVFAIRVPALRERRGDLGPLVAALVRELAAKLALPEPPITRSALARLAGHDWPGNVRELANVLETALILGGGSELVLPDALPTRRDPGTRFDAAMRLAIEDALRATRGKLYGESGAAARLGLKPATLQSKMKKLGIARRAFTS